MKTYLVSWYIHVDAEDPHDAAKQALGMQRDPESIATIFTITDAKSSICIDADTGAEYPSDFQPKWVPR